MKLPILNELETTRDMIDVFAGYNHNLRIGEGEFYDMKNLTSTNYPVLSPRGRRGLFAMPTNANGLISKDSLCYVEGQYFIINGYKVDMNLSTNPEDCPKTLVSMGAYVIIMPDKKYINVADVTDWGNIEASFTTKATVNFEMCKVDGSEYGKVHKSNEAPESPENLALWIDTSSTPNVLKQYSATSAMWITIPTTYIKISCEGSGMGKPFEVNDGVTISGIEVKQLSDLNNTMIIWAKGDDYIVVTGILDNVIPQDKPITIKRQMPNMDFITESGNRLWGCRYGVAVNGEVVNEIYASKLGDFKNWNCFMGVSTDSYAATVGTDGQFTGAVTHLGYPIFFKENYMHKVYGNYPSNYQINTTACRGVQKGSHKSLAIVNEVLYYKSRTGICAYDGSLPKEISYALGDVPYSNAVACSHGNKYYISMHDDTGNNANWGHPYVSSNMLYLQQSFGAIQDRKTLSVDGWELPVYLDPTQNLLPYPYIDSKVSGLGVSFVENGDGTIDVSGTSTGFPAFTIATEMKFIEGVVYRMESNLENCDIFIAYDDESGVRQWIGKGTNFLWKKEYTLYKIYLQVSSGKTVSGTVKPVLKCVDNSFMITQAYEAKKNSYQLVLDKDDGSEATKWNLFVYDTAKGMWHKEDNARVDEFCSCRGELYYIDHADGYIKTMFGSGTVDSHKVSWMAETGKIGTDQPDKKYISKLNIRMSLELGARMLVYIQYDSSDAWEYLFRMEGTNLRSFTVPIRPKRCDHLRLRFEGEGEVKIYSISKTIEQGSDV